MSREHSIPASPQNLHATVRAGWETDVQRHRGRHAEHPGRRRPRRVAWARMWRSWC